MRLSLSSCRRVPFGNRPLLVNQIEIQEDVLLAPYTTMKIGGRARYFAKALSEADVTAALQFARERGIDVFILGGGSNVLISDAGFDGLVIQISCLGIEKNENGDRVSVTAQAGEDWDGFVSYCVQRKLAGIECLSGIPGFVGGTPVQNVGAYGQDVSETIVSVRCLERQTLGFVEINNSGCGFSYRKSIFNSTSSGRYIVLNVTFCFLMDDEPKIDYKDIREYFGKRKPTLSQVREAVLSIRRSKSMVIDADDPNSRSAGSFFKNPIISVEEFAKIRDAFPNAPSFVVDDLLVKVPAAWLIENAGFHKGYALGNAGISSKHTLALINRGGASAGEIVKLKDEIQATVGLRFGIELQPEPIFVGFEKTSAKN